MLERDRDLVAEDLRQNLNFEEPKAERPVSAPSIFSRVRCLDRDSVEFALGSRLGGRMKDFVDSVDLSHPEIEGLFDCSLVDGSDFALDLQELISIGLFARANNMTRIMPVIVKKVINQERERRSCLRSLGNPMDNRVHVRLLESIKQREAVRHTKKTQTVELGIITKKGDELWNSLPSSFRDFVRGKMMYDEEIQKSKRKATRFRSLGCVDMAKEIDRSIDVLVGHINDCYYGFNRITVTSAAVVLARLHGYIISTRYTHLESNDRNCCVKVPRNKFFDFTTMDRPRRPGPDDYFLYQPRAYPAHCFEKIFSPETSRLMNFLDNFPEANGKPIFDHFIVVVPGVNYPFLGHNDTWKVRNRQGETEVYETSEMAAQAVDFNLVENGDVTPVLLGERDSKCYFLDYFRVNGERQKG